MPAPSRIATAVFLLLTAAPCAAGPNILVFSKTAGFRHDSIPDGVELTRALGEVDRFGVEATEDAAVFTAAALARYRAVVFLNTTGDVLDGAEQQALEAFVRSGGGWVGVHSAADTEYDWPFYGELLGGAWFLSHPAIQTARLEIEGEPHPCCEQWPASFLFEEEWYNFRANPRAAGATVHVRLDETSYVPGPEGMGADHPISWHRRIGAGRAFYTGLGHRRETYDDEGFQHHLAGAIRWAARIPPGDCDDDDSVSASELHTGIEIALAARDLDDCDAFDVSRDAGVSIEELVEAVARSVGSSAFGSASLPP